MRRPMTIPGKPFLRFPQSFSHYVPCTGRPAGIVAATVGKRCYPEKKFLLVRKAKKAIVPCGIPICSAL